MIQDNQGQSHQFNFSGTYLVTDLPIRLLRPQHAPIEIKEIPRTRRYDVHQVCKQVDIKLEERTLSAHNTSQKLKRSHPTIRTKSS
jgi:hypothetical protein